MSVIDYCKNVRLFSIDQEKAVIALTKQYFSGGLFRFQIQQVLKQVQLYWYRDSNQNNLGGFHMLSKDPKSKKYAIYINWFFDTSKDFGNSELDNPFFLQNIFGRISCVLGTILHQLTHYMQFKQLGWKYFVLQLPILRNYTIQYQAYAISKLVQDDERFRQMNVLDQFCLKVKYKFNQKLFFSKAQLHAKKIIQENNFDYMTNLFQKKDLLISSVQQCVLNSKKV